jgi:hypothetical protein
MKDLPNGVAASSTSTSAKQSTNNRPTITKTLTQLSAPDSTSNT